MTNLHISAWRRRKLNEYPTEELPETVGDTDEMGGTELRAVLWQALARLPEQQRTMLVLRYYEGRTDPEIADILDISVGTVKSSIWRSLRRMREDEALSFGRERGGGLRRAGGLRPGAARSRWDSHGFPDAGTGAGGGRRGSTGVRGAGGRGGYGGYGGVGPDGRGMPSGPAVCPRRPARGPRAPGRTSCRRARVRRRLAATPMPGPATARPPGLRGRARRRYGPAPRPGRTGGAPAPSAGPRSRARPASGASPCAPGTPPTCAPRADPVRNGAARSSTAGRAGTARPRAGPAPGSGRRSRRRRCPRRRRGVLPRGPAGVAGDGAGRDVVDRASRRPRAHSSVMAATAASAFHDPGASQSVPAPLGSTGSVGSSPPCRSRRGRSTGRPVRAASEDLPDPEGPVSRITRERSGTGVLPCGAGPADELTGNDSPASPTGGPTAVAYNYRAVTALRFEQRTSPSTGTGPCPPLRTALALTLTAAAAAVVIRRAPPRRPTPTPPGRLRPRWRRHRRAADLRHRRGGAHPVRHRRAGQRAWPRCATSPSTR